MTHATPCEIWLADLRSVASALAALDARNGILSGEDRARVAELTNPEVREERLASYRALRVVIERLAGEQARSVAFQRGHHGKPRLDGFGLDFSLAHAGGLALIGMSRGGRIGVDIEQVREVSIPEQRRTLIEAGAIALAGLDLPRGDGQARFIAAWTRLEAFAKADGCGMARVLGRVGAVGHGPAAAADGACGPGGLPEASQVMLWDLPMPVQFHAAVCLLGGGIVMDAPQPKVMVLPDTVEDLEAVMAGAAGRPQR